MNDFVQWIAAQAEPEPTNDERRNLSRFPAKAVSAGRNLPEALKHLPVHNFPQQMPIAESWREEAIDRNPDLWMYRERTVGLLRRYMRFSLETGRLPSSVGKEFFRGKVTAYPSVTFEDRVIFVSDVEKIVERLEPWDQQLIARVILQEHSHEQATILLHCDRKTIHRRLPEVLDLISESFLEVGLLVEVARRRRSSP